VTKRGNGPGNGPFIGKSEESEETGREMGAAAFVAQVSKPAVSPISKSAGRTTLSAAQKNILTHLRSSGLVGEATN